MIDFVTYEAGPNNEVLVLQLTGRLDEHTSDFLVQCLERPIEDGKTKIVLDCSHLRHITSIGLGALVRIHSRLKPKGGEVKIAAVRSALVDVLHIVHFDRLFNIHASVEEACETLVAAND